MRLMLLRVSEGRMRRWGQQAQQLDRHTAMQKVHRAGQLTLWSSIGLRRGPAWWWWQALCQDAEGRAEILPWTGGQRI